MRAGLKAAGFEVLTDSKYLTSDAYLLEGDITLNDNAHVAVNLTDGAKSSGTGASNTTTVKSNAITKLQASSSAIERKTRCNHRSVSIFKCPKKKNKIQLLIRNHLQNMENTS